MADPQDVRDRAAEEIFRVALSMPSPYHLASTADPRTKMVVTYMAASALARCLGQIMRARGDCHLPAALEPIIVDATALLLEDLGRFEAEDDAKKAG